jgi:hypothetical protein
MAKHMTRYPIGMRGVIATTKSTTTKMDNSQCCVAFSNEPVTADPNLGRHSSQNADPAGRGN